MNLDLRSVTEEVYEFLKNNEEFEPGDGWHSAEDLALELLDDGFTSRARQRELVNMIVKIEDDRLERSDRSNIWIEFRLKREAPWPLRVKEKIQLSMLIILLYLEKRGKKGSLEALADESGYARASCYAALRDLVNIGYITQVDRYVYKLLLDPNRLIVVMTKPPMKYPIPVRQGTLAKELAQFLGVYVVQVPPEAMTRSELEQQRKVARGLLELYKQQVAELNRKLKALGKV